MSGKRVRWTKQLQAIVDIIYESENHLTADQIYHEARKSLPNISLGTVYRNLKKLEMMGIVNEANANGMSVFYKHPFNNVHFECEICHRIIPVPVDIDVIAIERTIGMPVRKWNLKLVGKCRECELNCT